MIKPPKKEVLDKWGVDGGLAVIYRVDDLLLFYQSDKDPDFKQNEMVTAEQADSPGLYKHLPFDVDNLPNDSYMMPTFYWM